MGGEKMESIPQKAKVLGILNIVAQLDPMVNFYTQVLGFVEVKRWHWSRRNSAELFQLPDEEGRLAKLQLGNEFIYLVAFATSHRYPYPKDSHSNDLWFQR